MVLLIQYIALASLATLGTCDARANNGPEGAVAGLLAPAPLLGNATRDLADLVERDPEFNDFVQGAKKFVTQFIKRDISERDIQELAAQSPKFKTFMQKTGGFVGQMVKREVPTEPSAVSGAVAGIASGIKAAATAASPSGGATQEKQATPGSVVSPEKQVTPESGVTPEKQVTSDEGATSGKPAMPDRKPGPKNHGKHRGKHYGKHAHHQSQQVGQGKENSHAVGRFPQQQLQARVQENRSGPTADGAKIPSQEVDSTPMSKGGKSQGDTGAEDLREASTRKLIKALKKHQSQSKDGGQGRKVATQPSRSPYGVKYQGLEFQSEPYEMVRFQTRAHAQRPKGQKSPKPKTHTQNSPPDIHETSMKDWAEMQRQRAQAEKERHGEGDMDGQHGLGGTPGGQRGYGAVPGRAGSKASRSTVHRRYPMPPGNNMMMGAGGMGEDGRTGGVGIGGIGWGGSGMRSSSTGGVGRSYGGPRARDLEERGFGERHFEERDFEERDFEERGFEERDFDERDLKWVYDLLR